jgi:hypothetical protein
VAIGVEIRCGPLAGHPAPGEEVGFADDSPVEGDGFEPSVPRLRWGSVLLGGRDTTDV